MRLLIGSMAALALAMGVFLLYPPLDQASGGQHTKVAVQMNVLSDPGGHAASINMPSNITLSVRVSANHIEFLRPEPAEPWVDVGGSYDMASGEFSAGGRGTVKGYEGIAVTFTGHYDPDDPFGRVLSGIYTMGSDGQLPGDEAIEYRVKPKELPPTSTPTPTPTPTDTPPLSERTDFGCKLEVTVSENDAITGSGDDGVIIDCWVEHPPVSPPGSEPTSVPAQLEFDEAGIAIEENGDITNADEDGVTLDLSACPPVEFHVSIPALLQSIEVRCFMVIRYFRLPFGNTSGEPLLVYQSHEPVPMKAVTTFAPYGASFQSGATGIPLISTDSMEEVGVIKDLTIELSPWGDVNCSMETDSIDAALGLQVGAGLLNTVRCLAAGDVDQDGDNDSIDIALMLQFGAGLLGHLPTGPEPLPTTPTPSATVTPTPTLTQVAPTDTPTQSPTPAATPSMTPGATATAQPTSTVTATPVPATPTPSPTATEGALGEGSVSFTKVTLDDQDGLIDPAASGWEFIIYQGSGCSTPYTNVVTPNGVNLPTGGWSVAEVQQAGWEQISPAVNCLDFNIGPGEELELEYINREL